MPADPINPDVQLTVFYDGKCPLCVREIRWLRKKNTAGIFAFENYHDPECSAKDFDLTVEQLHRAIHGVRPDGTLLKGMAVFRAIYSGLGMGWLTAITGWPIIKHLFDGLYWCFARIRPIFGKLTNTCDDQCGI